MTFLTTSLIAVLGALLAALVAWPTTIWMSVNRLEKPSYEVLRRLPAGHFRVELRSYPEYLIAESEVTGDTMKEGVSRGFRNVAGYIFGKNSGSAGGGGMEKIAMTTPVRTEQPQKEVVTMTTPVRTELRRGGGTRAMKVSFVMPGKAKVANTSGQIFEALGREGLSPVGDIMVYQYHPPFLPGFMRRNEVAVRFS